MKRSKKRSIERIIIIIELFVLIVLLLLLLFGKGIIKFPSITITTGTDTTETATETSSQNTSLQYDESAGTYVEEEKEVTADKSIVMPGWTSITIPADKTVIASGIDFYNPESNEGYYDMTFALILDDTGETIYQSGLVRAGLHIQNITITKPLSAGTYNATVFIQPYNVGDGSATNNGKVNIQLIVE